MPVLAVQYLALSRGALWGVNRAYHVAIMGCVPATLQKLQTRHTYTSIIIELLTIANSLRLYCSEPAAYSIQVCTANYKQD